jgi:hypothetical protein
MLPELAGLITQGFPVFIGFEPIKCKAIQPRLHMLFSVQRCKKVTDWSTGWLRQPQVPLRELKVALPKHSLMAGWILVLYQVLEGCQLCKIDMLGKIGPDV